MVIHMFGAYYGLAASYFFLPPDPNEKGISEEEKVKREKELN